MRGTFALPFAEAESVMLTLARDLDAQSDAMVVPPGFQGRTARALAGAQRERRVVLTRLSESAFEAAAISGNQNAADESLTQAPSPQEVAAQTAKVHAMTAALDSGIGSVAAVMAENAILDDILMRRQLALTVHAAEAERSTGCFGRLDIPEAAAPRPVPLDPPPRPHGDGDAEINPKDEEGAKANDGDREAESGAAPTPQAPPADEVPDAPIGSGPSAPSAPSAPSVPGGPATEIPGAPPLVPATGLSGGGMPVPQSQMMQPMQMPMQQPQMPGAGMPSGGGFGFPMPAGMPPAPGSGFTAPQSGRQLDPLPKTRNRDAADTAKDLDMTLFPDVAAGGIPTAGAAVAGAGVGAAIAGAVTAANTTGITPPVVSAMPPANPMSGGGGAPGGPYGGGGMAPMAPMGSGAGMAGGGSIVKREPILAADGGAVGQESLRDSVATGIIGRATADAPPPERAA